MALTGWGIKETQSRMIQVDREPIETFAKRIETQEAKADRGKLRLTLVPPRANIAMAHVREYGTNKYKDPENWRRVEAYTDPEGWHIRPLKYRADFSYMERVTPVRGGQGSGRPAGAEDSWGFCAEQWRYVVEDVKSYATKTRVYEMKKQLMLEKFKIRIREV